MGFEDICRQTPYLCELFIFLYIFIHYVDYCLIMHHNVCIEMQGLKSMNICRQPHIFVNYSYIYIYIFIYTLCCTAHADYCVIIHHNIMYASKMLMLTINKT